MSIHLNLLAEQYAAEELRRKDPVKRAIWAGGAIVGVMVLWCLWLETRVILADHASAAMQARWSQIERPYQKANEELKETMKANSKLASLESYTTNRFLWGNVLNALQFVMIKGIQVVQLQGSQTFTAVEAIKPKTNIVVRAGVPVSLVRRGRPAESIEHIHLDIKAKAYSATPEGWIKQFKEKIASYPFFKNRLTNADEVKLKDYSPPQVDVNNPSRTFVSFTLECTFPDETRE